MADKTYALVIEMAKNLADIGATKQPQAPGNGGVRGDEKPQPSSTEKRMEENAEKGVKEQGKLPGFLKGLAKKMGINVGISSILKQSQIFTGTIGSMFQILGALVDVILAPFLPIIVPIIRLMGNMIPIIHKTIQGILNWYDGNLSGYIDSGLDRFGSWIINTLFGWLPDSMKKSLEEWWTGVDWGQILKKIALGALLFFTLKRFGFLKALAPLGKLLGRIPFLGKMFTTLWTKLGLLGGAIAKALIPGFGKIMGKNVDKAGKATGKPGFLQSASEKVAAKKGGGLFGGLKNLAKGGPVGILKGVAKKAIPGLSSAFLMYEGITKGIKTFKENRAAGGSFMGSLGKAGAVAGTGALAAGLSFAPGMGLVAPIAGGFAIDAMAKKMAVTVNVDGKEAMAGQVGEYDKVRMREQDNVQVQVDTDGI